MQALHDIRSTRYPGVYFWGRGYVCHHTFHDGYGHEERSSPRTGDHTTCRAPGAPSYTQNYGCHCETCDPHTYEFNTHSMANVPQRCEPCRNDTHPDPDANTPPTMEYNPNVGTPEDERFRNNAEGEVVEIELEPEEDPENDV